MKTQQKDISTEKENGRFYTPTFIVDNILDLSGYCGKTILRKHVIDNSCGDGAFLSRIVTRYCEEFLELSSDTTELKKQLETFIHGIEIESVEHLKCINNLSNIAERFGICEIEWDILCGDALSIDTYNEKMDFVLGNPPYVRIHNLGDSSSGIKKCLFAQNGMTDLYIAFYELGIKMLNASGILGYITPSSYFNSVAGGYMRKYFVENDLLKAIVDLKHFQAFSATTYTTITILQKGRTEKSVDYYRYDSEKLVPYYVETLVPEEYYVSGNYFFATKTELEKLDKIYNNLGQCDIYVKNGYATLCDPVFIHDFSFESPFIIPVVKASKGIMQKIFFPYNSKCSLIDESELKKDNAIYEYLLENREKLLKRSNEHSDEKYWYAFGRSQAINDTFLDKIAINSLLRDENDFKFTKAPSGTGVYGGLYIISETTPLEEIEKALKTKEFTSYISLLGKYKSGGYYTFSSKDVKRYLDYKFAYHGGLLC